MVLNYVVPARKVVPALLGSLAFATVASSYTTSLFATPASFHNKEWENAALDQLSAKARQASDLPAIVNPFRHMA
ncbi:hypothetical protein ACKKBG_A09545 [Auxenochlorella protothecoides x Auxenochlorella symbiontica]